MDELERRVKATEDAARKRFQREEARHVSILTAILLASGERSEKEAGTLAVKVYREAKGWARGGK
jgi:hypothetical protein